MIHEQFDGVSVIFPSRFTFNTGATLFVLQSKLRRGVMRAKLCLWVMGMMAAGVVNAVQESNIEYSADSYLETSAAVMEGPAYFAPGKERREYVMDGITMVNITRRDQNVIWSLMPEDKTYMEIKPSEDNSSTDLSGYQIEQTRVGPETVNGVKTTKNKIIMTGPKGQKMGGFMWVTAEGIVVKMDAIAVDKKSKERFKTELKNLKIGRQDASLFEIPKDFTKMDMGSIGSMMLGGDDDDAGEEDADGGEVKPKVKEKKKGFGFKDAIDLLR